MESRDDEFENQLQLFVDQQVIPPLFKEDAFTDLVVGLKCLHR